MKTILTRMKTALTDSGAGPAGGTGTLSYVRHCEVLHPDLGLTVIFQASLPAIFLVPERTQEIWAASQEKESVNHVSAYLILSYRDREACILGDSNASGGQGKGIIDLVTDFLSIFRGHRLAVGGVNYLNKPLDVLGVEYVMSSMGDNASVMVARIEMECRYLFLQTTLPGNI